jgi:protein TonB
MADVLLVYVHEDRVFGEGLATSLEGSGLTVARCENEFDYNNPAPCILILWSQVSTQSKTLYDIATQAQRDGRLITAKVDRCDAPAGLGRPGAFDLSGWSGDPDDQSIDPVFFAVDRLVSARVRKAAPPAQIQTQAHAQGQHGAATSQRHPPSTRIDVSGTSRADMSIPPTYTPIGRRAAPPPSEPVRRAGPVGGRPPTPPNPAIPPGIAEEALAWRRIEHSGDPSDYLNFLSEYGAQGTFSELAQYKLDKLTGSKVKAGGFMQHNPTPHAEPVKAKPASRLPEPRDAPRDPARDAPPWRDPMAEHEPARARAPTPPIEEDDYREPARGRQRTASGRPRRRVPVDQVQEEYRPARMDQPSSGGGGLLRIVVLVALLAGGGFAYMKFGPKQAALAGAPSEDQLAAAQRAGPLPDTEAPSPEPSTSLAANYGAARQPISATAPSPRTASAGSEPKARTAPAVAAPSVLPANTAAPMPAITYRPPSSDAAAPPAPAFSAPLAPESAPIQPAPGVALVQPAAAPPADDGYRALIWLQRPTGDDLMALFPPAAAQRGVSGQATLDCGVLATGRLDCAIASESPTGMGFGKAALAASKKFQAGAKALDGRDALGKRTRLPMKFQAPPPE